MAVLVAVALAAAAPAGAEAPSPTIRCEGFPGDTVIHWDSAYLAKHYGTHKVTGAEIVWTVLGFKVVNFAVIDGNNAKFLTTIFASRASGQLTLANNQTVKTGPVDCG